MISSPKSKLCNKYSFFGLLVLICILTVYISNRLLMFQLNIISYNKMMPNISSFSKMRINGSESYEEKSHSNFQKYAVLSVSVLNEKDYYFFQIPMIVKAWSRLGYKTIVLVISHDIPLNNNQSLALKTIEYLKKFNALVYEIKSPKNYDVILSLVSRLFACLIPIIKDNDFLITSDTDLYPIDQKYYLDDSSLSKNNSIFLWNAYCCGSFKFNNKSYVMFPMGHIGMRKKLWCSVMNITRDESDFSSQFIINFITNFFNGKSNIRENNKINRGDDNWYMDQVMIGVKIGDYHFQNSNTTYLVKMAHTCPRLDRGGFNPIDYDMKRFCDFHSFHHDVFSRYKSLERVFKNLFDNQTNLEIKNYYNEYMTIKNKIQ